MGQGESTRRRHLFGPEAHLEGVACVTLKLEGKLFDEERVDAHERFLEETSTENEL